MTIPAAQVMELRASTGAGMMDCKKALQETDGDLEAAKDFLRKKGITVAAKKSSRETKEGGIGTLLAPDGKSAAIVHLACETDFVARNDTFKALLQGLCAQVLAQGGENLSQQILLDGGGTVEQLLTESISTLGENLQLVQANRTSLEGAGTIGAYVHSNQKIGVLVSVQCQPAVAEGALEPLVKDLAMHIAASQVSSVDESGIDSALLDKEREIYAEQAKESGKPPEIAEKMVQGRVQKFIKEVTLINQPFVKMPEKTIKALLTEQGQALSTELRVQGFLKYSF